MNYDAIEAFRSCEEVEPNKFIVAYGLSVVNIKQIPPVELNVWLSMYKSVINDTDSQYYKDLRKIIMFLCGEETVKYLDKVTSWGGVHSWGK